MSLLAQAKMTEDHYIILRVKAQAAKLGIPNPHEWTMANIWAITAADGWAEAYAPSLTVEKTQDPAAWAGSAGADPNVITDEMICDAVTAVRAAETALSRPDPD